MKQIIIIVTLLLSSLSTLAYAKPGEESLDQMVAVVNEELITRTELDNAVKTAKAQNSPELSRGSEVTLEKRVLEQLINRKLQLQLAEQAGVKISNDEVEQAITRIAGQNNISVDQLYSHLKQSGMTEEAYRTEIREQIIMQKLQQHEIAGKVNVSPEEVTAFMQSASFKDNGANEYRIRDILIPTSDSPSKTELTEAKIRAADIMRKLRNGSNFDEVAKLENQGKNSLQGGDLGWRRLAEIPTAFAEYVTGMKKEEVAGPIQTGNGLHILIMTDVKKLDNPQRPDRKTVENMLFQQKFETALQTWMSKLRSQAFIVASN